MTTTDGLYRVQRHPAIGYFIQRQRLDSVRVAKGLSNRVTWHRVYDFPGFGDDRETAERWLVRIRLLGLEAARDEYDAEVEARKSAEMESLVAAYNEWAAPVIAADLPTRKLVKYVLDRKSQNNTGQWMIERLRRDLARWTHE